MNIKNRSNEYARTLEFFDRVPKSVLAAIAISYASAGGDHIAIASDRVAREWQLLFENGIVPQKPPADVVAASKRAQDRENLP